MTENVKTKLQLPEEELQAITGGCGNCLMKLEQARISIGNARIWHQIALQEHPNASHLEMANNGVRASINTLTDALRRHPDRPDVIPNSPSAPSSPPSSPRY